MATSVRKAKPRKPTLYSDNEHHSVSVRKIDNGFVVSVNKSTESGYESTEQYHEKRPKIDIQSIPHLGAPASKENVNSKALRQAAGIKKAKST